VYHTGRGRAGRRGEETARYLPKESWKKLSLEEQEEAEKKKREGSKKSAQYIENTEAAKKARKETAIPVTGYDDPNVEEVKDELGGLSDDEIEKARSYEKEHKNRETLIEHLARKIGDASWFYRESVLKTALSG
jgi:hypothetical protein